MNHFIIPVLLNCTDFIQRVDTFTSNFKVIHTADKFKKRRQRIQKKVEKYQLCLKA
jgi:hypothetical protein